MVSRARITVDGNEAVASVAHRLSEVIAIYPITPSSTMGESADDWSVQGKTNIWGQIPQVVQMQSEGGAIAAVHGAIQAGSLSTTFTASQGLLLMIPSMYKIAGELTPFCMHVSARTVATHALSIFGDHSDVMACRQTGFAMLASSCVQEAHDMAAIAHAVTLRSRIPIMHFFDGFRTSHEVASMQSLNDDDLRALMDDNAIAEHRERALTPDRPKIRGTAQNPDVFFQCREASNPWYDACPMIVKDVMSQFADLTGRSYRLFEYVGHPQAERVIVLMGSGVETADQTIQRLWERDGEKVGVVKVRLFRPFSMDHLVEALPATVKKIAVLDRTKEPGGAGEPLYQDVLTAIYERDLPIKVVGGRYGLSSKEFTPAMVKAVLDELKNNQPKNHFTLGILDDVTHHSLYFDPQFDIESEDVVKAVFFGLGSDGTVGANKNSIKIIGEHTDNNAQGYFVYDSKKAGAVTISHLRFGPRHIRSAYLIKKADFVACHQWQLLDQYDILDYAKGGAVFLLNSLHGPKAVWDQLPHEVQQQIIEKHLQFYVIDAYKVAGAAGMGQRINTVMQTCFFAISGVLDKDQAINYIKGTIQKTYGRKGAEVVKRNFDAVDQALAQFHLVDIPLVATATRRRPAVVSKEAPDLVQRVTALMMQGKGDQLPVSAFPPDGTWPTATTQWEKRNIAREIPIWDPAVCIQCNKCAMACPHAAIRAKVFDADTQDAAPQSFQSVDYKAGDFKGSRYVLQVSPEDCTGCQLCVQICPAKNKAAPRLKAINMQPLDEHLRNERSNYQYFLDIPDMDRTRVVRLDVKGAQLFRPLFEYSGACAGCGETPYVKLMTQLFGDRAMIANATGCSSIYGGNLPTTPYCMDAHGRGPTWANSLFEDNAEFGLGFRLGVDSHARYAKALLQQLAPNLDSQLVDELICANQHGEQAIAQQRARVESLRAKLKTQDTAETRILDQMADYLVRKSVWLMGGDGWAYDIGYGGLDHVLSMNHDVNVLVLDTEVYSNTGGQASKSTPLGAAAKFAAAGKETHKKDLGLMAMSYGHVYVASIAMGANDNHTVKALLEADAYPGPSLIIAYSHCIAHGYDLSHGLSQQKLAVNSGVWPLYRFDPRLVLEGKPPLHLDSPVKLNAKVSEYMHNETRFRMVEKIDPKRFKYLAHRAERQTAQRLAIYQQLANVTVPTHGQGRT